MPLVSTERVLRFVAEMRRLECLGDMRATPGPWVVSVSHADAKVAVRWDAV